MSFDGYGARGVFNVQAGEQLDFQMYVNADHGGFYRYEFSNGTDPSNDNFMDNAISPWYSLHQSAETRRGNTVGINNSRSVLRTA